MRYESRKSNGFKALAFGLSAVLVGISVALELSNEGYWWFHLISVPLTALMLSVYFFTYYIIEENTLRWRSGLRKGEIAIPTIKKVTLNTDDYGLKKASLAGEGLTLRYNKFDDFYISPAEEKEFIQALQNINPNIEVLEGKPLPKQETNW